MSTVVPRLKLGVIFGGAGEEHPISVKSALEVARHLDQTRYEPFWIGITRAGAWRLCDGPAAGWDGAGGRPALLSADASVHGLLCFDGHQHTTTRLDAVLPVLHGRLGEDGAIQGLLELSGIPYVGCDIQSSAVCMDKALTYTVVKAAGIATPNFWKVGPDDRLDPARFAYPVFVKPARSGSSFGVSKVADARELAAAVQAASEYDTKVLVEEAVVGSEVGCAIFGSGTELLAGEVDRISLTHGFFRIHQEHRPETYGSDNATFIVPADISPQARTLVQETAKAVYSALGCSGLARVDMFLTADGSVILNEVNTLPGLTSYSRYPRMMAAAGLPLDEVLDRLVSLALSARRR